MGMTYIDLVDAIHERLHPRYNKKEVELFLNAQRRAVHESIQAGEKKVKILGLGIFNVKTFKARPARNPKTGEPVHVPARVRVKYTMDAGIKSALPKVKE